MPSDNILPIRGIPVAGKPIPIGYRDQNGDTHGPFALDKALIRDLWLPLEGEPGAPIEDDWSTDCGVYYIGKYIQRFEMGEIHYCDGSSSATYFPYNWQSVQYLWVK
jgi:hypothetical protein